MEVLEEASSAEMEVSPIDKDAFEMEKKEKKGPAGNIHLVKGHSAVNGAVLVPMHKAGSFAENVRVQGADAGQKLTSLGVLTPLFADIVKYGKQPTFCPPHVGISEFLNSNSHQSTQGTDINSSQNPPAHFKTHPPVNPPISKPTHLSIHPSQNPPISPISEPNPISTPMHVLHNSILHSDVLGENKAISSTTEACSVKENQIPIHVSNTSDSSNQNLSLVKIDQDVINRRLSMCQFSIIGKISLAKGEEPWPLMKLRNKLEDTWKLHSAWRLIGLGKGYFQILLLSKEEWDCVWARGPIFLNPGMMRLQRWSIHFDPSKEKTTNAQVWFRISQLPWGLWDPKVISEIATKVGVPLKIDNATLNGDFGYYARVLVDVDISTEPISEVLIECGSHKIEVKLSPESLPSFCSNCNIIGHSLKECRFLTQKTEMSWKPKHKRGGEPELQIAENVCAKVSKTGQSSTRRKEPIPSHNLISKKMECFDEILGSNLGDSSVAVRIVDESITKEVFNVMDSDKKGQQAPDMLASGVGMPECSTNPVHQDLDKKKSCKGKNVFPPQVESPNRFSVLSENMDEDVLISSMPFIPASVQQEPRSCAEDEFITPRLPEKWSDIIDDDNDIETPQCWGETNALILKAQSDFDKTYGNISEFRARLQEDCLWLNKEDSHYDRDMYAEREHYKNAAKTTRTFIANLPKKDKKVKIGFRQPQGRNSSPKD